MTSPVFSADFARELENAVGLHLRVNEQIADGIIVAGLFRQRRRHVLWVVPETESLDERKAQAELWLRLAGGEAAAASVHVYSLPFADPYVSNSPPLAALAAKASLLEALDRRNPLLIVTTPAALCLPLEREPAWQRVGGEFAVGAACSRQQFITAVRGLGYEPREFVEETGEIAWRGNVVDLFPVGQPQPLRIEFSGGTIVSARRFDPQSQRSVAGVEAFSVPLNRYYLEYENFPAAWAAGFAGLTSLPELLAAPTVVVSDRQRVSLSTADLLRRYANIHETTAARPCLRPPEDLFRDPLDILRAEGTITVSAVAEFGAREAEIATRPLTLAGLDLAGIDEVRRLVAEGVAVYGAGEDARLLANVQKYFPLAGTWDFDLPCSFFNRAARTLIMTARPFRFCEPVERFKTIDSERWLREIEPGDAVVHREHGIGRFVGFSRLQVGDAAAEFLKIEYRQREYLYVPVLQLVDLKKYQAAEGMPPPEFDRLGGKTWRAKRERARRSILTFARELLELYAVRQTLAGTPYPPEGEGELEEQLRAGFPFAETEDQRQTIRDVLADLEAPRPMDRLVCGDVSFGKTEVAVRAAFRVIMHGRQVAILCPTTILAFQHFQTFSRRFAPFPIRVAMLSRLATPAERRRTAEELQAGRIDLVVGTHALLSRAVAFRNLGLYIIDEEQRFGVFQKEKLKQGRAHVDVLTLSATPIPRTLSLAFSGLQDISLIRTPPLGRLAIKNFVGYFSREVIVSAVLNEVQRDGLVFIVYNRIDDILAFRERIAAWLPGVRIGVIHARMPTAEIEKALFTFIAEEVRVLLSTTIIENGIDIPAVNTLIIVDADRFGLTQLYQLRGRIGRSSRQAYAYFLVASGEKGRDIGDQARQRLHAIQEFSELGSGYRLAEFDLRLRGAGALLGNKQHGHIEALGLDYYLEMLHHTVEELKGQRVERFEVDLKVHFPYVIEPDYIASGGERIRVYQRILEAREPGELRTLQDELHDRYGTPPEGMDRLFAVGGARLFAHRQRLPSLEVFADRIELTCPQDRLSAAGIGEPPPGAPWQVDRSGNRIIVFFRDAADLDERLQRLTGAGF